ncbi:uncharacterized protein METZ01_LOCUS183467, partial [marine metagenome]
SDWTIFNVEQLGPTVAIILVRLISMGLNYR